MHNNNQTELQARLGLTFHRSELLTLALTHRSFLHERPEEGPESNERLEFLGDSFLGVVIAGELYKRFPDEPEGKLTEMRSRLVRTEALADIGARLGIGACLRLGRGEEQSGGRERSRNLARGFEAVVGAVFVDQGYRTAMALVLRCFKGRLAAMDERFTNYKSLLQEAAQGSGQPAPEYHTVSEGGPGHTRQFTVEVSTRDGLKMAGLGSTKRQAEQAAAKAAYEAATSSPIDGKMSHR